MYFFSENDKKTMGDFMAPERRQYQRINQVIEVHFKDTESFAKAYMTNVGSGGLFIKAEETPELNQDITVRFTLPDNKEPITAEGKVVWVSPKTLKSLSYPSGMGVKFVHMSHEDKQRLDEFVAKILS